jgi:hypothetical protein
MVNTIQAERAVTEHAAVFDGLDDYVEIADHPDYSIATTGELTVVALIRPDGTRLGIGSHFQDELTPGQPLLVAGAWDATRVSIYRDGVVRDRDLLDQSATGGPTITPEHGDAPLRIGTRDFNSFFQGAISRVAIFNRKLADSEQAALQTARLGDTLDSAISATAGTGRVLAAGRVGLRSPATAKALRSCAGPAAGAQPSQDPSVGCLAVVALESEPVDPRQ